MRPLLAQPRRLARGPLSNGPDWFGDYNILHPADSLAVAAVVTNLRPPDEVRANAERFVATWNALAGIPTDKLRSGIVKELIAAGRLACGVVPAGGSGVYKYVDAEPLRALLRELGSE